MSFLQGIADIKKSVSVRKRAYKNLGVKHIAITVQITTLNGFCRVFLFCF